MINKAVILLDNFKKDQLILESFVFPEFWLLHGKPMIEHLVGEALGADCREIIIIGSPEKKSIIDYLKQSLTSANSGDRDLKIHLPDFHFIAEENMFSALLKAKPKVKDGPVLFLSTRSFLLGDNSFHQMSRISNTAEKTVVGLVGRAEKSSIKGVETEKIAERIYRLNKITDDGGNSRFVLANRSIISSEIWGSLQTMKKEGLSGDVSLEGVFIYMIAQGVTIYGCHLSNDWWDLGLRENWLKVDEALVLRKNEQRNIN